MNKIVQITLLLSLILNSCSHKEVIETTPDSDVIENGLLPAIQVKGDSIIKFKLADRMEHYKVPGLSIAIVENGKIKWAKGYGMANTKTGSKIDEQTLFQAGSISKPVATLAALKLVEEGKVDLDVNVNLYLKDWKVPENRFTEIEKVTLRRLLNHTAGITVHGFPGYQQTDTFPTINDVLNGNGNTAKILVDTIPGSIWRYSGGGFTVMEKLVEDVSRLSLEDYMAKNILQKIGMNNSSYQQPVGKEWQKNISAAYNNKGELLEGLWNNYPEQAAAGLWTTPTDLAKYCLEVQEILSGKENGLLSKKTAEEMLTKGKNNWGLGLSIQWETDSLIFRHGGKNEGFTNEMIAFANQGNAVIIMTNADNGGLLMDEILRAISNYYQWGISEQEFISVVEMPLADLKGFEGSYKLNFQVPEIGDYLMEMTIEEKHLKVFDPNNGETNILSPIGDSNYIDIGTGLKARVELENDTPSVTFNGRFTFVKVEG